MAHDGFGSLPYAAEFLESTQFRRIVYGAYQYLPSQASFIFHEIKGDVQTYVNRMHEHGIAVGREFAPITGFNRLTLGRPDEMAVFVEVLKSFREQGWV